MNKKIINGALLGLLVVAAPACSFVSCKDYDDDFASIRKEINADKADLVEVKNGLDSEITTLKSDLKKAQDKAGELERKLADYAKTSDLGAYAKTSDLDAYAKTSDLDPYAKKDDLKNYVKTSDLNDIEHLRSEIAKIATLTTRVEALETAKTQLTNLINGKVDQTAYDQKVREIFQKIDDAKVDVTNSLTNTLNEKVNGLNTSLGGRLNLQQQALDNFQALLEGVEKKNFLSQAQIDALNTITTLEQGVASKKSVQDLKADIERDIININSKLAERPTEETVKGLIKADVDKLTEKITEINKNLNILQYNTLVGLELIPDSYYRGIEAIESNQFAYNTWTVNQLVNGVVDYKVTPMKGTTSKSTSRYAEAVYHLNPAGAEIDTDPANFTYLPIDRAYRATNSAAVITVKKATVENGLLKLVLDIQGATKDIDVNKMVTTAALQYKAPGTTPRIITSAYDAIYTNKFFNLRIWDIKEEKSATEGLHMTSTSGWDINNQNGQLAIATKIRTIGDQVVKGGTEVVNMDETAADKPSRLTKNGFHYEYHLVKQNKDDKSYEAFTLDNNTGVIKANYDQTKPYANVGKKATVRVTLVQGKDEVATLGFFTVRISQMDEVIKEFTSKNELKFTCDNRENAADKYEANVADLAKVIKDKASLEANGWEFVKVGGELTQFTLENNVAKDVAPEKKLGKVTLSADGQKLVWDNITKAQVADLRAGGSVATYVKVQKTGDPKVRFYVKLTYNPASEQAAPVAEFVGKRIETDWFKNNIRTNEQEFRMHFNILHQAPEFNRFEKFKDTLNRLYTKVNNQTTVGIKPLQGYSQAVLNSVRSGWRFVTPKETVVPGNDGKKYNLTVSQDGLELLANNVVIAKITNDQEGTIELLNNPTTQVLLNHAGHKQLKAYETLTARVGYVTTVCANGNVKTLETKGANEFDVKFFRPLDLTFNGAVEFTDANAGQTTKTLDFTEIVKFTDWRDRDAAEILAKDGITLENLYGVKTIYVADKDQWTTKLNQDDDITKTKLLANYGDRGLDMTGGTALVLPPSALIPGFKAYDVNHLPSFTYTTQQRAFKTYDVRVPVKVGYSWGTFDDYITVTINGTLNNDTNNTRRK